MPTVHEILKQSGLTDDQIASLDSKAITAFGGVLSTAEQEKKSAIEAVNRAEQEKLAAATSVAEAEKIKAAAVAAREQAELAMRSNAEFYETKITPALNGWESEKQKLETARINAEAQAAFYKTQNEAARGGGFVPTDAPGFVPPVEQPRNPAGQYVTGAPGGIPGSPTFSMEAIDERLGNGISNVGWAMQEYQRLSGGQFLPDSFDQLSKEAANSRLPFRDYVERKYDFAGKRTAIQQRNQQEHDDKVRAEALAPMQAQIEAEKANAAKLVAENDKKWAERLGNNPDIKLAQPSKFADVHRAVRANERPDPLSLNETQRRQATSQAIRTELSPESQVA